MKTLNSEFQGRHESKKLDSYRRKCSTEDKMSFSLADYRRFEHNILSASSDLKTDQSFIFKRPTRTQLF